MKLSYTILDYLVMLSESVCPKDEFIKKLGTLTYMLQETDRFHAMTIYRDKEQNSVYYICLPNKTYSFVTSSGFTIRHMIDNMIGIPYSHIKSSVSSSSSRISCLDHELNKTSSFTISIFMDEWRELYTHIL